MTNPTPAFPATTVPYGPAQRPTVIDEPGTLALADALNPVARSEQVHQPAPVLTQNIIITNQPNGPGLLTRAVWFLFAGWWLTGLAITIAWVASLTVILLPVSFMLINRIPLLLTLRTRNLETAATVDADGTIRITTTSSAQQPFWMRAVWFVFVGWWATGVVMAVAYILCLTIIGLPPGLMLFNRVPAVMTLQRN